MRKERTLLIIGIWVALLPHLGFPNTLRNILFLITGIMIVYLAYLFRLEAKVRISKVDTRAKSFVDSVGSNDKHVI